MYASLQPFTGWRTPPDELFGFLTAPWPRYAPPGDIVLNVAAYLPFGAMLLVALHRRGAIAIALATLLAGALSLALESVQMFLPSRIASNVDLMANTGGAALGALAAWLCTRPALLRHPLAALRRHFIRTDVLGDCGLILLAVWLFIQFDPAPLALSSGDLRDAFALNAWYSYTPAAYQLAESGVAALALIALGLLAAQLAVSPATAALAAATALVLTVVSKSIALWSVGRSASLLQWLTPGISSGFVAALALLALLLWLPAAWRGMLGILCMLTAVTLVNVTPENPYQSVPPFLLAPQPTHLSSFSSIVRVLSRLWPFATVALFLALLQRTGNTPSAARSAA